MQVKFDSSLADTQLARNRFVGKTLGSETHDFAFAHSQDLPVQGAVRSVNTAHYMPQSFHRKSCNEAIFRRNRSLPSTLTGKRSAPADQALSSTVQPCDTGRNGSLFLLPGTVRKSRTAYPLPNWWTVGGAQVEFGTAILHVRKVKQGTPSTHPILGDELRALRRLQREQEPRSAFVFTSERGAPFGANGFALQTGVPLGRRMRYDLCAPTSRRNGRPGLATPQGALKMKIAVSVIAVLMLLADLASAHTARIARRGPQDCFLPPDVAVTINALGPYCSSPRGPRYRVVTYYRPHYFYPPYSYSFYYRPFFLCWNWSSC